MKSVTKTANERRKLREEIVKSSVASFKIEGIHISNEIAAATLKKIEANLGK